VCRQPLHRAPEIIYPQADVVERRKVHSRLSSAIQWLHEVDFDRHWSMAAAQNIFVDIFHLASKVPYTCHVEKVDPESGQRTFGAAQCNLLNA
jgi:hypothetical protein